MFGLAVGCPPAKVLHNGSVWLNPVREGRRVTIVTGAGGGGV